MTVDLGPVPPCGHRRFPCTYVVLESLLRFHGRDPALHLFTDWDFGYGPAAGFGFGIWGRRQTLAATLESLGIEWRTAEAPDADLAWHRTRALLEDGLPVAVAIDVYPLAQAGCFPRLHHAPHLLVLAGYDEAEGTVRLVDPSPWQPGEMEVTRALFAACWDTAPLATDPAATPRYAWQWVRPAERGAISAGLLLERMRCNAQAMATTRGADDFIRGLAGIEALAGDVACWHDRPAAALGPLLARCYRALLEIALLREGHAGFLRSASDRCCLPGAGVLAEGFERLSEGWSVARNLLWRAGRDDPRQVLPRAASRLADLAARERTLLDRLCACLPGVPG